MRARARDGHAGCMGTVVVDLVPNVLKPSSLNFPTAQEYFDRLRRARAALRQSTSRARSAGTPRTPTSPTRPPRKKGLEAPAGGPPTNPGPLLRPPTRGDRTSPPRTP